MSIVGLIAIVLNPGISPSCRYDYHLEWIAVTRCLDKSITIRSPESLIRFYNVIFLDYLCYPIRTAPPAPFMLNWSYPV
jgi:hypothetical protein